MPESVAASHNRPTLSVKHACEVLRAFSSESPEWGVNDLGRRLGLHKSTVSRLLATLAEQRLVRLDPTTEKYRLGLAVLELAGVVLDELDLRQVAIPYMRELWTATRETVNLGVWDLGEVVIIEHLESPEPIKLVGRVGLREPAHCTSMGKLMLAFSEPAVARPVIDGPLVGYTPRTIVGRERLLAELEAIRQRGYSINEGEFHEAHTGVAAPIRKYPHDLAGAVSVAGPSFRFPPERLIQFGNMVKETAAEVSRQLGTLHSNGRRGQCGP